MKAHEMFLHNIKAEVSGNVSVEELRSFGVKFGTRVPWSKLSHFKIDRNTYCFEGSTAPVYVEPVKITKVPKITPATNIVPIVPEEPKGKTTVDVASMTDHTDYLIPEKDPLFVPFGISTDLNRILRTREFMPIYITGESGIGKTLAVIQSCAKMKRELIRFNVTNDTDESDLFGDFRLLDGDMIFSKGPVVEAMERGAVLLLDEVSAGNPNKLLALQSVLEGKGVFLKKIGKQIVHKEGFTVISTDNSKGKGSSSGRYIGLNVQNEAFLDRFVVTLEHGYPTKAIERKILRTYFTHDNIKLEESSVQYINTLTDWAEIIRKTFADDGCDEVISTRRLVNICKLFKIFNNKTKAIALSINRFDEDTIESFGTLFNKLWDGEIEPLTKDEDDEDINENPVSNIPPF